MTPSPVVFLVDVDNTLLDNDRIQNDLKRHLEREFGPACRDRYWAILEQLFAELGYRDYLGALQRYRIEHPQDIHLLSMSSFLVDYPFANRLYPGALDVLERFRAWGPTVILSAGDVVFQPRKVERSGISEAVEGHLLIYNHKEKALDDVERRYPAEHYVLVDDKLRILTTVKRTWRSRVTTVFPRQAQYAHDQKTIAECPPADVTVERIGDLLNIDLSALLAGQHSVPFFTEGEKRKTPIPPQPGPENLARQQHARSTDQRHAQALHRRVVGDGADLKSDDLRSRHQKQQRLRPCDPRRSCKRKIWRGAFFRFGAGRPHPGRRSFSTHLRPDQWRGRVGIAGGISPAGLQHGQHSRRGEGTARPGGTPEFINQDSWHKGRPARYRRGDLCRSAYKRDPLIL